MQGKQEITALLVQPLRLEFGAVVSPMLSRLIQVGETLPWEFADRNILPAPGHDNSLWHLQHLPFAVAMKAGILRWQFHSIELGIVCVLLLLCSPPIRSVPSSQRDLLKKHEIQSDLVTLLLNARQCTPPKPLYPESLQMTCYGARTPPASLTLSPALPATWVLLYSLLTWLSPPPGSFFPLSINHSSA